MRTILYLTAFATAGTLLFAAWNGVAQRDTAASLKEKMRASSDDAKGKLLPMPEWRPTESRHITIARDPFQSPTAVRR